MSVGGADTSPQASMHTLIGYWEHWLGRQVQQVSGPTTFGLAYLGRTVAWYFWPAWPLAAYAVWRWRAKLGEPSLALPVTVLGVMTFLTIINPHPSETQLAAAAPVVALLAAPSLTTLRRSLVNMIDWFAVMCFSFLGFALWAYWLALVFGVPEKLAFRAAQFAPGFVLGSVWLEIVLGGLASASWILLVKWRVSRQPAMIWRAVVLSASGLTLVWFLMMTLWLPVLNERMGFRSTAESLPPALSNPAACVNTRALELAPRAAFYYFASLHFAPSTTPCNYLLEQSTPTHPIATEGKLIWRGQVPAYKDDEFRLYRR
jgi:4-amino-4-deoxy-L-arabinose transferase-like glycosyltransferase